MIGIGNLRLYRRYQRGGDPPQMRPNEGALTLLKIPSEKRKLVPAATVTIRPMSPGVTERTTELLTEDKKE